MKCVRLVSTHIADGPGPTESMVQIETRNGPRELVVTGHASGTIIEANDEWLLVQVPTETTAGDTRVWMRRAHCVELIG